MPDTLTLIDLHPDDTTSTGIPIELVGHSAAVDRLRQVLRRASALDTGILLVGERGVDVESIARDLHVRSRPEAPFVAVDCGAEDVGRLEMALFGAAPTRAPRDLECAASGSLLAAARGGTLFLEGVGELPAALQARLARAVRDGEVRLEREAVPLQVRTVASTPPGIDDDVRDRRFRTDLFRRLSVTRINLPPLRDRREDLPALAERVLLDLCAAHALGPRHFTQAALALFGALGWSGNLAELRSAIKRIVLATSAATIQIEHVVPALQLPGSEARFVPTGTLREARIRFEREYIAAVLQHHGWQMGNAAQTLGIQRPNLYRKVRQLGLPIMRLTD